MVDIKILSPLSALKKCSILRVMNNIFINHEWRLRRLHEPTRTEEKKDILYKDECYKINSCIYEVNRKLGTGFLEAVYQEALEIELRRKNIPFISQQELEILYDGIPLTKKYIADLICFDKILLEIKAVSSITDQHKAQLLNYLTATGFKLGILVNFNSFPKAEIIRIAR
ncbi:MAG: GxxExxY protein [Treponema sp.]|nr:GxxExxY protein [Treponema sp.]